MEYVTLPGYRDRREGYRSFFQVAGVRTAVSVNLWYDPIGSWPFWTNSRTRVTMRPPKCG